MDKIHPDEQKTIRKIQNSITTLNEMFESLLNISKLDSHTYRPSQQSFDLADLTESLEEFARPLASRKGLQLEFVGAQGQVMGDSKAVHQILMNLISNAIHYTDQGRVNVTLLSEHGCLTLQVTDTGRGIAPEEQSQIFREFYRVDETRPLHDGLGLGLSIVQRLCQLIEARIEVASELGQGARFVVRTPYRWLSAALPPSPESSAGTTEPLQDPSRIALKGCVVAVIEDDPVVCEAYRQTLASRGAQVVVLPDDPQALLRELELIDQLDLIVSDYRLRTTTGDRVIQTLRESFNREVPAIIVTADTSPTHIHAFQRLNIPVLHKPASFQQIIDAAEKAVAEAQQAAGQAEVSAGPLSS